MTAAGDGKPPRTIRARYVVGADGMHSTVREQAGIAFEGGAYEQSFVLADVHMSWSLRDDEVQLFFSPDGLVVVAPLPGGQHRIVATLDDAPEHPDTADMQRLLDTRGPASEPGHVEEIVWSSRFRVHHRVVDRYRAGRVVVAFTDRMTRTATLRGHRTRAARNTAIGLLGRIPAFRHRIATELAELRYN